MAKAEADGEPPRAHHKTAGVEVSRLVNGLPVGGDLEYAGGSPSAVPSKRAVRSGNPEKLHAAAI